MLDFLYWFNDYSVVLEAMEWQDVGVTQEEIDKSKQQFQNLLNTMPPDDYIPFEDKNELP